MADSDKSLPSLSSLPTTMILPLSGVLSWDWGAVGMGFAFRRLALVLSCKAKS
ncbi:TPA: hypothetical protein ACSEXO_003613 [Proteus mirabilis]|uniref:hypothetical protein n=1 Tax=Proteus mirabilis TaxID=584 RepID=UPI000B018513|nr:hypothetical protein [Proteus mirabilis]MCL8568976.1 hypothetical protein [Proteus mirabilis]MCL8622784.1 hypothetical protein [Proteus mirabilis]MDF7388617.1 hypothetical protein [Proteus mirabilis]MDF7452013.1 hypothetical protein [Proteus mirabilis]MDM3610200.1 hypothetical protein [Proteus mirabilis]